MRVDLGLVVLARRFGVERVGVFPILRVDDERAGDCVKGDRLPADGDGAGGAHLAWMEEGFDPLARIGLVGCLGLGRMRGLAGRLPLGSEARRRRE